MYSLWKFATYRLPKTVTTKRKFCKRSWMSTNITLLNAAQSTLKGQIISLMSVRGISYIAEKWCQVHSLDSITAVKNSILVMFCCQHSNASPNIRRYFRRMKCDCFHGWRKNVNWELVRKSQNHDARSSRGHTWRTMTRHNDTVAIINMHRMKNSNRGNPVSILHKSLAGRYWPVRVTDGLITARCRFIKNASWVNVSERWAEKLRGLKVQGHAIPPLLTGRLERTRKMNIDGWKSVRP